MNQSHLNVMLVFSVLGTVPNKGLSHFFCLSQPGGFGESLGNDVALLQRAVQPCKALLEAARRRNLLVIHTREGHRKELSNLHPFKLQRPGAPSDSKVIGKAGPKGRILVQGEPGHDIIPELYPQDGEPIIDKPGKGSFYATDLDCILKANGIETLIVCGVTTEVCVHTTIREGTGRDGNKRKKNTEAFVCTIEIQILTRPRPHCCFCWI